MWKPLLSAAKQVRHVVMPPKGRWLILPSPPRRRSAGHRRGFPRGLLLGRPPPGGGLRAGWHRERNVGGTLGSPFVQLAPTEGEASLAPTSPESTGALAALFAWSAWRARWN